jgi:hypothetical protein
MQINFVPFAALWTLLALVVLALFLWRRSVASKEDDQIHISDSVSIAQQSAVAAKLDQIDKWGKTLTVVTVLLGVLLAAAYIYQGWINASKIVE